MNPLKPVIPRTQVNTRIGDRLRKGTRLVRPMASLAIEQFRPTLREFGWLGTRAHYRVSRWVDMLRPAAPQNAADYDGSIVAHPHSNVRGDLSGGSARFARFIGVKHERHSNTKTKALHFEKGFVRDPNDIKFTIQILGPLLLEAMTNNPHEGVRTLVERLNNWETSGKTLFVELELFMGALPWEALELVIARLERVPASGSLFKGHNETTEQLEKLSKGFRQPGENFRHIGHRQADVESETNAEKKAVLSTLAETEKGREMAAIVDVLARAVDHYGVRAVEWSLAEQFGLKDSFSDGMQFFFIYEHDMLPNQESAMYKVDWRAQGQQEKMARLHARAEKLAGKTNNQSLAICKEHAQDIINLWRELRQEKAQMESHLKQLEDASDDQSLAQKSMLTHVKAFIDQTYAIACNLRLSLYAPTSAARKHLGKVMSMANATGGGDAKLKDAPTGNDLLGLIAQICANPRQVRRMALSERHQETGRRKSLKSSLHNQSGFDTAKILAENFQGHEDRFKNFLALVKPMFETLTSDGSEEINLAFKRLSKAFEDSTENRALLRQKFLSQVEHIRKFFAGSEEGLAFLNAETLFDWLENPSEMAAALRAMDKRIEKSGLTAQQKTETRHIAHTLAEILQSYVYKNKVQWSQGPLWAFCEAARKVPSLAAYIDNATQEIFFARIPKILHDARKPFAIMTEKSTGMYQTRQDAALIQLREVYRQQAKALRDFDPSVWAAAIEMIQKAHEDFARVFSDLPWLKKSLTDLGEETVAKLKEAPHAHEQHRQDFEKAAPKKAAEPTAKFDENVQNMFGIGEYADVEQLRENATAGLLNLLHTTPNLYMLNASMRGLQRGYEKPFEKTNGEFLSDMKPAARQQFFASVKRAVVATGVRETDLANCDADFWQNEVLTAADALNINLYAVHSVRVPATQVNAQLARLQQNITRLTAKICTRKSWTWQVNRFLSALDQATTGGVIEASLAADIRSWIEDLNKRNPQVAQRCVSHLQQFGGKPAGTLKDVLEQIAFAHCEYRNLSLPESFKVMERFYDLRDEVLAPRMEAFLKNPRIPGSALRKLMEVMMVTDEEKNYNLYWDGMGYELGNFKVVEESRLFRSSEVVVSFMDNDHRKELRRQGWMMMGSVHPHVASTRDASAGDMNKYITGREPFHFIVAPFRLGNKEPGMTLGCIKRGQSQPIENLEILSDDGLAVLAQGEAAQIWAQDALRAVESKWFEKKQIQGRRHGTAIHLLTTPRRYTFWDDFSDRGKIHFGHVLNQVIALPTPIIQISTVLIQSAWERFHKKSPANRD